MPGKEKGTGFEARAFGIVSASWALRANQERRTSLPLSADFIRLSARESKRHFLKKEAAMLP
jgi:hypothetical protein